MILTRQERERLVLDLYNQGKTVSEISQEVRMSFSGIGAILKKAEQENETSKDTITAALLLKKFYVKLFMT
jgi:transcriptional regulator